MLHILPRGLPPFGALWDAAGRPHACNLAKALHVDVRTVYRWQAADQAPRPAALVLWLLSPYGWQAVESHHHYAAQLQRLHADDLARQVQRSAQELARARAIAQHHSRHAPQAANVEPWPVVEPVSFQSPDARSRNASTSHRPRA
jgi:hypothetical protein